MDSDNLIIKHLQGIRAAIDQVREDNREMRLRMAHVEETSSHLLSQYATVSSRIDRVQVALERIERRLELTDAP